MIKKSTVLINFLIVIFLFSACEQQNGKTEEGTTTDGDVKRREIGQLVIEDIPEIPEDLKQRMQQYMNTRSAGFSGWEENGGGMFIITRFGETRQVHYVSGPGAYRQQITFFDEPVSGLGVRPSKDENGFLFMKDIGGNEMYQIYYYNMEDASYELLTDGKSRNSSFLWHESGEKFAYVSNKRNGTDFDIYVANMDEPKKGEMVYEASGYWIPVDWTEDGNKMLVYNYISINENMIHIFDLNTQEMKPLVESDEKIAMSGSAKFTKDGKGIFYTSDQDTEFQKLRYYDIETGESKMITGEINWDVESMSMSRDGKTLAFVVNANGFNDLYMMNTSNFQYSEPNTVPDGLIGSGGFNPAGDKFSIGFTNSKTAGDVYVMETGSKKINRWTFSEIGGLNTDEFVNPELISYPTFDSVDGKQRMIPAFYYKPEGEGPFPVVVYFHGGPEAQFTPGFISTFQYWIKELGVAVLAPNVRGSAGYGKSYLTLDNGFLRENSVKDGGALLDWIKQQPELNENKVGVFGGSYGGYMVLAMMTNYNDRIACGVDIVGISNFVTFLENTGDYRRDLRRVEYGDERDPEMREFLIEISPSENAHKITKPLFVVQGLNDPRVPATEAEQIVAEVRKNDGEVWYLLAKDEGHGFSKKKNRDFYTYSVVMFWEKFLLN